MYVENDEFLYPIPRTNLQFLGCHRSKSKLIITVYVSSDLAVSRFKETIAVIMPIAFN